MQEPQTLGPPLEEKNEIGQLIVLLFTLLPSKKCQPFEYSRCTRTEGICWVTNAQSEFYS